VQRIFGNRRVHNGARRQGARMLYAGRVGPIPAGPLGAIILRRPIGVSGANQIFRADGRDRSRHAERLKKFGKGSRGSDAS